MFGIFLEGVVLGLTLALFFGFGPAFFSLIQTSIHRGFKSALFLAFGIFINDSLIICLCLMSSIQIITEPQNQLWFGISAGIILIIFGIFTYTRKCKEIKNPEEDEKEIVVLKRKKDTPGWFTYIAKGFFMNIMNPFIWIFWVGWVTLISAKMAGDDGKLITFFAGTLLTIFSTDLLKAYGAYSVKKFFTPKMIGVMNKIAGIGLMGFGVYMIVRVIVESLI